MSTITEDRFWALVNKTDDGCWLWTGPVNRDGYGVHLRHKTFEVPR